MPSSYATFSTLGRVKRMMNRLEETAEIHNEAQSMLAAPSIQTADSRALLAHSKSERVLAFRTKAEVRKIREGLRRTGWFESSISPILKDNETIKRLESLVKDFFLDAVKTSTKAAQLAAKYDDGDHKGGFQATTTDELTLCSAVDVLRTVVEEEDESKLDVPYDTFTPPSEPDSFRRTPSQDEGNGPGG